MRSKLSIKLLSLFFALALALSIPSMVVANDDNGGCKLQGTWIYSFELPSGFGPTKWLATINGTGDNKGTIDWEFIAPSSHPESCPSCYWSSARGVWEKTGRNTYNFTTQGFYVVNGAATQIILNEGTMTLLGCNTAEVTEEGKLFNPGETDLYWTFEYQPGIMQRLLLHQPSPIQ